MSSTALEEATLRLITAQNIQEESATNSDSTTESKPPPKKGFSLLYSAPPTPF